MARFVHQYQAQSVTRKMLEIFDPIFNCLLQELDALTITFFKIQIINTNITLNCFEYLLLLFHTITPDGRRPGRAAEAHNLAIRIAPNGRRSATFGRA